MWTISLAMATSHFRTLNEFHPGTESIKTYLERVQLHFTANSVADVRQVHILLSAIGSSNYVLLSDLLASETPTTKTLDEITAVLKKHYEPKRAVITEKYHFHKRDQAMDKSIAEYDAALRKLAIHCKFETYLEEALRDRFVCGLCNEAMQRRLLAETDLTLTKAMELTQSMEAADHNSRAFKATEPTIKKISSRQPQRTRPQQPCCRCRKSGHKAPDCGFKDADCHACGKKGHIAPACRSKPKNKSVPHGSRPKTRYHDTHLVQHEKNDTMDSESKEFHLFKLNEPSSNPVEVTINVEDKPLTMELDTGAVVSIISEATRRKMFPKKIDFLTDFS